MEPFLVPERYHALTGRRQALLVALVAVVVLDIADALSQMSEIALLDRLIAGKPVGDAELTSNDARVHFLSIAQLVVYLITAGLFIGWVHRAYRNLGALGAERRYSTGWAIGGWFVPIMAFFRPKQIVNDIWWGTAPSGAPARQTSLLLWAWWLGFVATELIANSAFRATHAGEGSAGRLRHADSLWLTADVLEVIVAVLAVIVIQRVTDRMEDAARGSSQPAGPPTSFGPPVAAAL
jgi:hypothetical protein